MEIKMIVEVKKDIEVTVNIEDVAEKINMLPIKTRWNFLASLINGIDIEETDLLDDSHLEMIGNYLLKNSNRLLGAMVKKV